MSSLGHRLIENRHGLIADAMVTPADGFAEREAALVMWHARGDHAPGRRRAVGADKGDDSRDVVTFARAIGVTPHVTQNHTRAGGSAIDARTTRHAGHAQSQRQRPRIERVVEDRGVDAPGEAAGPRKG